MKKLLMISLLLVTGLTFANITPLPQSTYSPIVVDWCWCFPMPTGKGRQGGGYDE